MILYQKLKIKYQKYKAIKLKIQLQYALFLTIFICIFDI